MFGRKMKVGDGDRHPPSPARRRPGVASLQVGTGRLLAGGYEDHDIEEMAQEDGRAQLYTSTFGKGNRQPRAILANNEAARVGSGIIGCDLHDQLSELDAVLERNTPRYQVLEAKAQAAAATLSDAANRRADLEKHFHDEDLGKPDESRKPLFFELTLLAALGVGDIIFISVTYQVLGLSDRPILGPLTELHLAATTSVAALLITSRIGGHRLKRFTHFIGNQLRHRADTEVDDRTRRRYVAGAVDAGTETSLALAGVTMILLGVSGIREAFLEGRGIPAHASSFLAVQGGIAVAGWLLAAWFAHPYERQWRSTSCTVLAAENEFNDVFNQITQLVGDHNALVGTRGHVVGRHLEWDGAQLADAGRQNELYARRVLLSQPEPTTENLVPDALPQPAGAPWAKDHRDSLDAAGTALLRGNFERQQLGVVVDLLRPEGGGRVTTGGEPSVRSGGGREVESESGTEAEATTSSNGRGPR